MTSLREPVRLSTERAKLNQLPPDSHERALAQLRYDEQVHVQACQAAATTISAVCSMIDAVVDGTTNPNRPYLTWTCCPEHGALKARRQELDERARLLGVESAIDVGRVILD